MQVLYLEKNVLAVNMLVIRVQVSPSWCQLSDQNYTKISSFLIMGILPKVLFQQHFFTLFTPSVPLV